MNAAAPHFLLVSEAVCRQARDAGPADHWQFVLQSVDDDRNLAAADCEPQASGERLELMAVVRGLEALEQPSHVTLFTQSRYIRAGLAHGLDEWRENAWRWERFGRLVPVKNHDLWQRVDRALKFHQVECRSVRFDAAHRPANHCPPHTEHAAIKQAANECPLPAESEPARPTSAPRPSAAFRRSLGKSAGRSRTRLAECVATLLLVGWLV